MGGGNGPTVSSFGEWAMETLCVEPLAVVGPDTVCNQEGGALPSMWVQKYKAIGHLLIVTYEGYEGAITELLRDIASRHLQQH